MKPLIAIIPVLLLPMAAAYLQPDTVWQDADTYNRNGWSIAEHNSYLYIAFTNYYEIPRGIFPPIPARDLYIGKLENGSWSFTMLDERVPEDGHMSPSIAIDNEGYIHIAYGSHNSEQLYKVSNYPESIYSFSDVSIPMGGKATYPQFIQGSGRLYLMFRYTGMYSRPLILLEWEPENRNYKLLSIIADKPYEAVYPKGGFVDSSDNIHMAYTLRSIPFPAYTHNTTYVFYNTTSSTYTETVIEPSENLSYMARIAHYEGEIIIPQSKNHQAYLYSSLNGWQPEPVPNVTDIDSVVKNSYGTYVFYSEWFGEAKLAFKPSTNDIWIYRDITQGYYGIAPKYHYDPSAKRFVFKLQQQGDNPQPLSWAGWDGRISWQPEGDFNYDDTVNADDYPVFMSCFNGSLNPPKEGCQNPSTDMDYDGDVDVDDYLLFAAGF